MDIIEKQSLTSESDTEPFDNTSLEYCEDTTDQNKVVKVDVKTARGRL